MYNLADNRKGVVYILDGFDPTSKTFKNVTPYLTSLRNPNSIAFYTEQKGVHWFYVALTDRLLRYRYSAGEVTPNGQPEILATFPDYGLSYKYGGWHLTRTIAFGSNGKLYVSVGSSCNACEEKEKVRASILEMNTDGSNQRHLRVVYAMPSVYAGPKAICLRPTWAQITWAITSPQTPCMP